MEKRINILFIFDLSYGKNNEKPRKNPYNKLIIFVFLMANTYYKNKYKHRL